MSVCTFGLDLTLQTRYRHILKLPFIAEIIEKAVWTQAKKALEKHNILANFQSAFRKLHSVLKVSPFQSYGRDIWICPKMVHLRTLLISVRKFW